MPTPDEVDAAPDGYAEIDLHDRIVTVARWRSDTYDGRTLVRGRWYNVSSRNGQKSLGLVDIRPRGESYAFEPYAVGTPVRSLNEGITHLATQNSQQ